jgi:hypothetical protein
MENDKKAVTGLAVALALSAFSASAEARHLGHFGGHLSRGHWHGHRGWGGFGSPAIGFYAPYYVFDDYAYYDNLL